MADDRTYIRVHDGIEDHPKIVSLSDKAFRLLITTWGWCSRHRTNGRVPADAWKRRGTTKSRNELISAGLVKVDSGGVAEMHDYLEHQRSAQQIAERSTVKQAAGQLGNHRRWHLGTGNKSPACKHCAASDEASQDRSHVRSQDESREGSQTRTQPDRIGTSGCDRKTSPDTETETEEVLTYRAHRSESQRARAQRTAPRDLAATAHSPAAHRLIENYAATRQRRPPARVLAKLGPYVDELITESWPDQLIADALTAWGDKGLDPATLPSVANEIANRAPVNGRPATTDQRTAAVQALKVDFRDHPTNRPQITTGGDP